MSLAFLLSIKLYASDGDNLSLTPMGRVLMDAGKYVNGLDTLQCGIHFSDVRIGFKGRYNNYYYFKVDIGFSNNKILAKDIFVGYRNKEHTFQLGQFYEPFSMDMLGSTSDMRFPQVASSTYAFGISRKIGILYNYDDKKYSISLALFSDASFAKVQRDFNAYSLAGRFIYRFLYTSETVFSLSASPSWSKTGNEVNISSVGISSWEDVAISKVNLSDARSRFKIGGELLYLNSKISFQSEIMYANIKRLASNSYQAMGYYSQFSWILSGAQYVYDRASSCLERPQPRSLEIAIRYSYLDQNDNHSQINGGCFQDFSIGLNYYFNKYIAAKLSYSLLKPIKDIQIGNKSAFSMLQLRTQFVF